MLLYPLPLKKRKIEQLGPRTLVLYTMEPALVTPALPRRKCRRCDTDKPLTLDQWPHSYGKPIGQVCRPCVQFRKAELNAKYAISREASRQHEAKLTAKSPTRSQRTAVATIGEERPSAVIPFKQEEVQQAFNAGAALIKYHAREVLERVMLYATDDTSPHHEWALKLLAERIMPAKLYTSIGEQAAGLNVGAPGKKGGADRPNVYIQIVGAGVQANGGAQLSARVVDVETVEMPSDLDDLL